jgi:hypothetical protein
MLPGRSWLVRWKMRSILRVPAGDPSDDGDCECGGDFLLTEGGAPIQTQSGVNLQPES